MNHAKNIAICHRCEFRAQPRDGKCNCRLDNCDIIEHATSGQCPVGFFDSCGLFDTDAIWRGRFEAAATSTAPYPGGRGNGIVMPGGGVYFDAAYVSIRVIRMLDCMLPIELWHLGPIEMLPWQRAALDPLGVILRDAFDLGGDALGGGWQLKSFAVSNSAFEKVLFLDADCYPVYDPSPWFTMGHPEIFWPDRNEYETSQNAFDVMGIDKKNSRPIESGQFFVDRLRRWRELALATWMNQNSEYYYQLIHGDKETFRIAWLRCGTEMCMPTEEYRQALPAMVGFNFQAEPAFVHRCCGKLSLSPANVFSTNNNPSIRNDDLPHEQQVWEFLEELRGFRGTHISQQRRNCCNS